MDASTIPVVDDTPTSVDMVRSVLEAEGFRTLTASDGAHRPRSEPCPAASGITAGATR
jgi:CheY-like chemotaxis protein